MRLRFVMLALALPVAAACVRAPNPIPPPEPACFGAPACETDDDCEPRGLARSPCANGCCLETGHCSIDTDCVDGAYCDLRRGLCFPESTCEDTVASLDCEPGSSCLFVLQSFACAPDEQLPPAENCEVRAVIGIDGETIPLEALALDGRGAPVAHSEVTWTASVGDVAGNSLLASCAAGVCDGGITAVTLRGGAQCSASARIYAPARSGRDGARHRRG